MSTSVNPPTAPDNPPACFSLDERRHRIVCSGDWTVLALGGVDRQLARLRWPPGESWTFDTTAVTRMDTAGAWVLHVIEKRATAAGARVSAETLSTAQRALRQMVSASDEGTASVQPARPGWLEKLGRWTVAGWMQWFGMLSFVGELTAESLPKIPRPTRIRWKQVVAEIEKAGVTALPIIALLSFLMGVVIAYQAGGTLERYGANIFLVDLVAITMLREMGPLVAAIVVAGRTGSAYTAEIGTMTITEEIDALRSIGVTPYEMLALPKYLALLIALPLLTVCADALGVFGGMVISNALFGIDYANFLQRLPRALWPVTYWVGLAKAPVFAVIITTVGCYQGFSVRGSAESVGRATTASVVQSIFLVIVADAVFSILFNLFKL